jgi:AraC-like DNA-binding protein
MLYPGKKASQSLWHFLPSVLIFLNLWLSYFFKQKIVIQDNFYDTWFSMDLFISVKFMQLVFIGTSLFYLTKIGIDLYQNFSIVKNNFDEIKFLLITIIFLLIFFTGVLAIDVFDKAIFDSGSGNIALKIMLVKPLFILFNFYVFYRNPALLFFGSDNEIKTLGFKYWYLKPRSKNGTMPDEKFHSVEVVKNLILQIESVIKEREVFRNEKYGLRELALEIKMPLGQLRFLFREYCELSFIEYRNYQRVEDFKRCSQQKYDNQNFTIEAIGCKCGFGSINSLHRSIKKYENCTPSDLWQRTK